jgi:hypothetical protein
LLFDGLFEVREIGQIDKREIQIRRPPSHAFEQPKCRTRLKTLYLQTYLFQHEKYSSPLGCPGFFSGCLFGRSNNPGDWAMHCHMTHHTMNQMGHNAPNLSMAK